MTFVRLTAIVPLLVALSACTKSVDPIDITKPAHSDVAVAGLNEDLTIGFEKAIVNIPRNEIVGAYYTGVSKSGSGNLCNYMSGGEILWDSGREMVAGRDSEMSGIFRDSLTALGYKVVGDDSIVFEREAELNKATYRVAARIIGLKANICKLNSWWDGRPLGKMNGEMKVDIEWSVYSSLERKTVMKIVTSGWHETVKEKPGGIFLDAFYDAVDHLGKHKDFLSLFTKRESPSPETVTFDEVITIKKVDENTKIIDDIDEINRSIVTVRSTSGHGSGFFVSEDGFVITNAHVVGESDKAMVLLSAGIELESRVVRKNKVADTALLKVSLAKSKPLPISLEKVKALDEVYAVGAPLHEELHGSVSKGVVSARRFDQDLNIDFIQSDVSVQPGSSGGPLLNANGNVVGITVSSYINNGAMANANLFIPIEGVLDSLGTVLSE